ncbi:MAG: GerMN domain-containing protein, partial [Spirochaetes bacterium]|nr:GerMN domain-containing protein [Spirochaetota bacterium]
MAQKKRAPNKGKGSRTTSAQSSRSTRTPAGCLFWLVLLAVVIAVAVAAREPIKATFARYFGKKTESARGGSGAPSAPAATPAAPTEAPTTPGPEKQPSADVFREPEADVFREPEADVFREPEKTATKPPGANAGPVLRRARLHFIAVDPDGTTRTIAVDRDLPQSDSPLRDAILALLAGPDAREKGRGLASMIPAETRLRSATVKSRTAYLDFTESFRFTAGGIEGLVAELR